MTTILSIIDLALLAVLTVIVPLVSYRDMQKFRRSLAAGRPHPRVHSYRTTILAQWVTTALLLGGWLLSGRSLVGIGLLPAAAGWQWAALAAAAVITVGMVWYHRHLEGQPEQLSQVRGQLGDMEAMMPRTPDEVRWFDAVSVTAGVCEEVVYRGLLMTALTGLLGLWPAVLISSLIFGLGHAYQGVRGVLKTSLAGVAMALVVVGTGSLYAAVIMHAVLDLVQGRMVAAALSIPTPEAADPLPQT